MKKQSFCSKAPQGATEITKYTSGGLWKAACFLRLPELLVGFSAIQREPQGLLPP